MALKLKKSISRPGTQTQESSTASVPVLYRVELDRHREEKTVRARLERVEARARARASTS
jgi:polysaccharide deacetylase 2 family uncharacterized protein YibQ